MDPDGEQNKTIEKEGTKTSFLQRYLFNVGNVFSSIWVRSTFQNNNGYERFILGGEYRFLLYFRVFLVILYLFYQIIKY